jgi:hypothetical protein
VTIKKRKKYGNKRKEKKRKGRKKLGPFLTSGDGGWSMKASMACSVVAGC